MELKRDGMRNGGGGGGCCCFDGCLLVVLVRRVEDFGLRWNNRPMSGF